MDAAATPSSPAGVIPSVTVRLTALGDPTAAACEDDACELPAPPAPAD